ncbi:MucBP domain-containing protein [Levilactobacillus cerevisiae]|uniref:MucBP domain-containing protein n=1 Tax=Levilactobacillus cerevisiae TaxID=1704076 RepID=UPI0013DDFBD4|nr:MucBP domain-containing protein [Levilactobacillus cerevisiae]
MKRTVTGETKEHYKSYKAGKRWIYTCITVIAVGLGLVGASEGTAQAATDPAGDVAPVSQVVQAPAVTKETVPAVTPEKQVVDSKVAQPDTNDNVVNKSGSKNDGPVVNEPKDNTGEPATEKADVQDPTTVTPPAAENPDTSTSGVDQPVTKPAEVKDTTTDKQVNNLTPPTDPVKPVTVTPNRHMMMRAAVAKVSQGPKDLTAVPVTYAPDYYKINGKDATEWMPDASLRALLIGSIDKQYYNANGTVTSADLYQYAGFDDDWMKYGVNTFEQYFNLAPIKNLEGLQYFTNLRSIHLSNAELPKDGMIDFSFAPNLREFSIFNVDDVTTDWQTTADDVLKAYFASNSQLQYLDLNNINLTGGFPDLTAYPELYMVSFSDNQMTGNLPDISYLKNIWELNVNSNQLSGQLPDISNWSVQSLRISNNKFTGTLPNTATLTSLEYATNQISTGIVPGSYTPGTFMVGYGQTLNNTHHVLTNAAHSFDPTDGTFTNFMDFTTGQTVDSIKMVPGKFSNGALVVYAIVSTDNVVNHNQWALNQTDASSWFTVTADPNNADGFLLVANMAAKDGDYVIKVVTSDGTTSDYSGWVNFSVINKMKTVTPVTPETPDPDATTGTVTVVSVDEKGNAISTKVVTGNVGDAFNIDAPEVTGYQVTGKTNATGTYTAAGQTITFTYTKDSQVTTGGDGATIDETSPADKVAGKTTTGGAADTLTGKKQQVASQTPSAVTNLKASGQAATVAENTNTRAQQQAQTTTLPQTSEVRTGNYVLAGLATLIGALGLAGLKLRKHE